MKVNRQELEVLREGTQELVREMARITREVRASQVKALVETPAIKPHKAQ